MTAKSQTPNWAGPFSVVVRLRVETSSPDELAQRFGHWGKTWVNENRHWTFTKKRLDYFDAFEGPPHDVKCDGLQLSFQVETKHGQKWWKDWLILRLLKEAQVAFLEVRAVEGLGYLEPSGVVWMRPPKLRSRPR
jgi:hypothetical protein